MMKWKKAFATKLFSRTLSWYEEHVMKETNLGGLLLSACYTVHVRGSEYPQDMLMDAFDLSRAEE